jgi:hypothetical protein
VLEETATLHRLKMSYTGGNSDGVAFYFYAVNNGCMQLRASASISSLNPASSPFQAGYAKEAGWTFAGVMVFGEYYDPATNSVPRRVWALVGF